MSPHRLPAILAYLSRRGGQILRFGAGAFLILAGVLGLALPILPGWALIAAGILVLAPKSRAATWLRHLLARLKAWARRRLTSGG